MATPQTTPAAHHIPTASNHKSTCEFRSPTRRSGGPHVAAKLGTKLDLVSTTRDSPYPPFPLTDHVIRCHMAALSLQDHVFRPSDRLHGRSFTEMLVMNYNAIPFSRPSATSYTSSGAWTCLDAPALPDHNTNGACGSCPGAHISFSIRKYDNTPMVRRQQPNSMRDTNISKPPPEIHPASSFPPPARLRFEGTQHRIVAFLL
ncbi:hypothetical protein IWZ01DRAFT_479819 [Phyllosticta capitalensis]